jgi:hypothetical protein
MSAADTIRHASVLDSPYVGLNFYTQENAAIFFGRDSERTVLISNLRASRLTLVYAKSGTGKSSLLRAGVAASLADLARRSFDQRGTARNIPVVFSSWRDDPTAELIVEIDKAIRPFLPAAAPSLLPRDRLETAIESANRAADAALLVILDQFEGYLHQPGEARDRLFADELAACINRADLRANFLISLREDAYFALGDVFKGRINNVYGNYFRLEHLTREAAREAIEKPIETFNRLRTDGVPIQIEPGLVDAVLDQFGPDQAAPDQGGAGRPAGENGATPHRYEVHASYLQLVMKRLWDTGLGKGARTLRLQTLNDLGGAERIVRTHVERELGRLTEAERDAAADIFHYLVTPSGTKMALTASDLAAYSGRPVKETNALLQRLAGSDIRILRPVPPPPGRTGGTQFEISHDLLVASIQRWGRHYEEVRREQTREQEKVKEERRARTKKIRGRTFRAVVATAAAALIAVLGIMLAITAIAPSSSERPPVAIGTAVSGFTTTVQFPVVSGIHPGSDITGNVSFTNHTVTTRHVRLTLTAIGATASISPAGVITVPVGHAPSVPFRIIIAADSPIGAASLVVRVVDAASPSLVYNESTLNVTITRPPGFLARYWWAIIGIIALIVLAILAVLWRRAVIRSRKDVRGLIAILSQNGWRLGAELKAPNRWSDVFRFSIRDEGHPDARLDYPQAGLPEYQARRSGPGVVRLTTPYGLRPYEVVVGAPGVYLDHNGLELAFRDTRRPRTAGPSGSVREQNIRPTPAPLPYVPSETRPTSPPSPAPDNPWL